MVGALPVAVQEVVVGALPVEVVEGALPVELVEVVEALPAVLGESSVFEAAAVVVLVDEEYFFQTIYSGPSFGCSRV